MELLEEGSYKNLPHYSVIGDKISFYIWVNEEGGGTASNWIRGRIAFSLYNELAKLSRRNKKKEFIELIKEIHGDYS